MQHSGNELASQARVSTAALTQSNVQAAGHSAYELDMTLQQAMGACFADLLYLDCRTCPTPSLLLGDMTRQPDRYELPVGSCLLEGVRPASNGQPLPDQFEAKSLATGHSKALHVASPHAMLCPMPLAQECRRHAGQGPI